MRDLSASPHPPPGQDQIPLLPTDHALAATPAGASRHLSTIVLQPEDHGEVGSATPQVPPSASFPALEPHTTKLSPFLLEGQPSLRKRMGYPLVYHWSSQSP
ncbi:hypothetical protein LIER_22754 [Lithospermum erythrorhizon]|uniref:Uncharacterized protein n=1 Tax=Lithospermum erythrorhizon TaxID=34254 RepID=A0AAV3QV50_LITER